MSVVLEALGPCSSQVLNAIVCPLPSPSFPSSSLYHRLSSFIEENYKETSKERAERLKHLREQAEAQRRHSCINQLFESWDNDSSGYLELDELQMVIKTWKNFTDEQALLHGKKEGLSSTK